jgi:Na+-driven multidrug efflux pump
MAAPLVVSFWMRSAVTLVDTVFAALLGDAEVAAIGLIVPVEFLMIAVWVGLSTGLTSSLSRAMGAREHRRVEQYLAVGWRLVWLATPLFTVVGAAVWFLAPHAGLAPDVARSLQVYGTVLIVGSACTTFWSIIPDSLVKAHQDTRSTMWAGIWSNVINVGLNTLFLFVFEWGLFGIALSTVLGRIGGLVYALARARYHELRRLAEEEPATCELDPAPYRAILGLAVPSSVTFALMATEGGLINALLATMENATEAIAAYSIYYRVVLVGFQPVIAISVALLPYAARRLSMGDVDGVRRGMREAGLATAVYSVTIVGPAMLLGAPWLASSLAESPLTASYSTFALRTVPIACLVSAPFLMCRLVFEAMQRGKPGLMMAILRYVVLTGPLAWAGMAAAGSLGYPTLHGLIVGTLAAAGISSAAFSVWLNDALRPGNPARAVDAI